MTSNCNVAKFSLRFPSIFWYSPSSNYLYRLTACPLNSSECSPTVLPRAFLFWGDVPDCHLGLVFQREEGI
jgi:hypothetical protein